MLLTAAATVAFLAAGSVAALFFATAPAWHATHGQQRTTHGCQCVPFSFVSPGCCSHRADISNATRRVRRSRECDVDVRDASELGPLEFQRDYVLARKPVLITGLADGSTPGLKRWAALDKWTNSRHLPGMMAAEPHRPTVRVQGRDKVTTEWPWSQWEVAVLSSEPEVYLKDWRFWQEPRGKASLMDDIHRSPGGLFDDNWNEMMPGWVALWYPRLYWGNAGSSTEDHFDVIDSAAWMLTLNGKKQWRLAENHHERAEKGLAPRWKHCTQLPGDLMFQPTYCYHGVDNAEATMGVTLNGWNGFTAHIIISRMWEELVSMSEGTAEDKWQIFEVAKRWGLLRWVFLRFVTGLLGSPQVTNTESFRHFAHAHAEMYNGLLHEARSLDLQLAAFGLIMFGTGVVCMLAWNARRKLARGTCAVCALASSKQPR